MELLMMGREAQDVKVVLPGGEKVTLEVCRVSDYNNSSHGSVKGKTLKQAELYTAKDAGSNGPLASEILNCAEFYTVKDSGDDPDVTNGTEVHVKVQFVDTEEIPDNAFRCEENKRLFLTGGKGVGTVTKPGLQQEVGQSAINTVPRDMIFRAALDVMEMHDECREVNDDMITMQSYGKKSITESNDTLYSETDQSGRTKCFLITVSVPEGEELAKKTFNPRLGIEGGISILGTTGIVEPMSEASIVATIETEIRQKLYSQRKEAGHESKAGKPEAETDLMEKEPGAVSSIIAVPGNYGMRYVERLGLDTERVVTVSNYIGDAIDLAISYGCREFLLVGNIGKVCKLAAGIMNTYSKVADGRWEIFAAHLALCGGDVAQVRAVKEAPTTEEMLTLLEEIGLRENVMASIMKEIEFHMEQRIKGQMKFGVIVYSERFGMVGKAGEVD
jgi:cobalt-precorrin-5B (C1)-methyltransferase